MEGGKRRGWRWGGGGGGGAEVEAEGIVGLTVRGFDQLPGAFRGMGKQGECSTQWRRSIQQQMDAGMDTVDHGGVAELEARTPNPETPEGKR